MRSQASLALALSLMGWFGDIYAETVLIQRDDVNPVQVPSPDDFLRRGLMSSE